jgi:hypothetical protein
MVGASTGLAELLLVYLGRYRIPNKAQKGLKVLPWVCFEQKSVYSRFK